MRLGASVKTRLANFLVRSPDGVAESIQMQATRMRLARRRLSARMMVKVYRAEGTGFEICSRCGDGGTATPPTGHTPLHRVWNTVDRWVEASRLQRPFASGRYTTSAHVR